MGISLDLDQTSSEVVMSILDVNLLVCVGRDILRCKYSCSTKTRSNAQEQRQTYCSIPRSEDHKPNRSDEGKRIENVGSVVMWAGTWRVGGILAMSRAFGNRMLKQFVVAKPEIQVIIYIFCLLSYRVVKQIQLVKRPNNVFDKKTWNNIHDEFNRQTELNFNNNQLSKRLDVLRTRYYIMKSAYNQNDFAIEVIYLD
ncbi:hypothetical protein Patl1_34968 [Pistacia atlantica]|uniref:Uncharacterized protein n=1 Tax=Pistacia atlantica TaxID=434234 RepID=A0ACC0ZVW7_9ROSI|nr:hypothetical protein Patl1_34968 [Pistacia atlantica]